MINQLILFVTGIFFGFLGTYISFKWSWEWFGDIWHSNSTSAMWVVLYILFLVIYILLVKNGHRLLPAFTFRWWHYPLCVGSYLAGTGLCTYWAFAG